MVPILELQYAGFWRRFAASCVDHALLIGTYLALAIAAVFWGLGAEDRLLGLAGAGVVCALLSLLVAPLYFGLLESGPHGATLGKRLFCIRVTRPDAQPIGWWRATARHLAHWLSAAPAMLGYLLQPFTPRKQALHDMLTDCVVVQGTGSAARNIAKLLLATVGALLALAVAVLAAWAAINAVDEPLQPEAAQALVWKLPGNAGVDNGYLVLLDMKALASDDPFTPYRCDYQKQDCLRHYLDVRTSAEPALARADVLLQRYLAMLHARNFVETEPPRLDSPGAPWSQMLKAAELMKVRALYDIADGRVQPGMAQFTESAQFSRRLLRATTTLIGRMIAAAMVQRDMRFISSLALQYPAVARSYATELTDLCAPIAGPDYSLHAPIAFEEARTVHTYDDWAASAQGWRGLATRMFYLPHATHNAFYATELDRLRLAEGPADRLTTASHAAKPQPDMGYNLFGLIYLRNPIGKLLLSQPRINFMPYVEKQHDTDGYVRLVSLQLRLIRDGTPKAQVGEVVDKAPATQRNPYTREAMQWDAANSRLSFVGRQPSNHNLDKSNVFTVSLP